MKDNLSAQCWLWKDHTSYAEAARITELAAKHRPQFIAKCGNTYSSEWFWSKIWHCLKSSPEVFAAAYSWVELADFIPSVLAGVNDPLKIKRGVCAAGHKALYADDWGGLPDKEFLTLLDPKLADLRDRLYEKACDATIAAGNLSSEWAETLELVEGIPIAIGEFDVHYGAIASGVEEGVLVKAIGTSTCDCCVVKFDKQVKDIPGICGIVKGAISAWLLRHRGGTISRRRYFQLVGRGGLRGRCEAARHAHRRSGQAKAGTERFARTGLEQWKPDHSGGSSPGRINCRANPSYHARGNLSRLDRSNRFRRPHDH